MYPEEALKRFHQANPMKQRGNAWDVAEAITYLASPAGRFINGDLIIIDGGQAQWGSYGPPACPIIRSEEHTSELQSLMRISYADFCLKKKIHDTQRTSTQVCAPHNQTN